MVNDDHQQSLPSATIPPVVSTIYNLYKTLIL